MSNSQLPIIADGVTLTSTGYAYDAESGEYLGMAYPADFSPATVDHKGPWCARAGYFGAREETFPTRTDAVAWLKFASRS